jgi:hypothetical protein
MGTLSEKNIKRRLRRAKRNALRYMQTTRPSFSDMFKVWYIHNADYNNFDFHTEWIDFFESNNIPIIDGKFPETFPRHLFNEMKLDKKEFPQLCFSIGK